MNNENDAGYGKDDARLRQLLLAARPVVALPPRFRQEVWRRIERAEAPREAVTRFWLDALVGSLLGWRLLLAGTAGLMVVSGLAGALHGAAGARAAARAQYVASVAPQALR